MNPIYFLLPLTPRMSCKLRKNIFERFLCWVLLLQMVNICIDTPDQVLFMRASAVEAHLVYNEVECITEVVIESLFGDDLPETEQRDNSSSIDRFYISMPSSTLNIVITAYEGRDIILARPHHFQYYNMHYAGPSSPPPKSA